MPLASCYVFLLGLACGIACLTITAYRRVSPRWLRWLLFATGGVMIARYVTMALFTHPEAPARFWAFRHCWFGSIIGLSLPSVFAIDQLIKHPAMTPAKLLRWMAPVFAVYLSIILFGAYSPQADVWVGWIPQLSTGWRWVVSISQGAFVIGLIVICVMIAGKIPNRAFQTALYMLAAAHAYLGIDGLLLGLGGSYFRPFLFSEMLTLLTLWYAFEVGTSQHAHS